MKNNNDRKEETRKGCFGETTRNEGVGGVAGRN